MSNSVYTIYIKPETQPTVLFDFKKYVKSQNEKFLKLEFLCDDI